MYPVTARWMIGVIPAVMPIYLAAQTLGLPLSYRPVMSGFSAALDAGGDKGGFRAIGLTGIVALGHMTADSQRMALFNLSGTVARVSGESGAASTSVGAELSLLGSFAVGVNRSRWAGVTRGSLTALERLADSLARAAGAAGDELAGLETIVESADREPTEQARAVFAALRESVAVAVRRWRQTLTAELPALNSRLKRQGAPPVQVVEQVPERKTGPW